MRRHLCLGVVVVLLAATSGVAFAGAFDSPGAAKAITCSACHGAQGASASTAMPILAGMWPVYFKKAITDFAEGKRPSAEMEPYAKMVLQMGVDDLATYFSSQPPRRSPIRLDPAKVARGESAAKPCLECHRGGGTTIGPLIIPDLRGQPPGYLRNQMKMFKANTRSPGDENLMKVKAVMNGIPDTTLDDLAEYFSSLR